MKRNDGGTGLVHRQPASVPTCLFSPALPSTMNQTSLTLCQKHVLYTRLKHGSLELGLILTPSRTIFPRRLYL